MTRSVRRKKLFMAVLAFTVGGMAVGAVFSSLIAETYKMKATLNGVIAGFLIAFVIGTLESFVFDRIRRGTILPVVLAKTAAYTLVIVAAYLLADVMVFGVTSLRYDMEHYLVQTLLFSLGAVFLFVMLLNINRLLGQRALLRLFLGRYHTPVIEHRIFMFLDVASSTAIAERLGDVTFHRFLNDFFFDATGAILEYGGEIYKYVGDEVIVTWSLQRGIRDGDCVSCFFAVRREVERLRDRYMARYGIVPSFRAGIHCGPAVVGEMGDFKREVAFLGDVMNTTARIQSECRVRSRDIIISDDLVRALSGGGGDRFRYESMGTIGLRGKSGEMELFSVTAAE
ncbi:MAG: adenylate/guanylate cyclase domain-containing protein [Spirochaetes bacterium]|nr:adenylate/guanylate cyclase domain-containing protein [Spirochaetota bacterium]